MQRDLRFDGLKFVMILLVVLGHLKFYDYGLNIKKIIYFFHMPIFVFLSGYFTSLNKSIREQNKWIKKTLLIYVFAQLAHTLLSKILDEEITWRLIISPHIALWYLVSLLYWRISYWRVFYKCNDIHLFILSLFLAILSGYIPIDHDFSFQRSFAFFPFFVMGVCIKKRRVISLIDKIPLSVTFICLLIGFVIAFFFPWEFVPRKHYVFTPEPIIRTIQTVLAIYLCILILRISKNTLFDKIAKYRQYTLWIYIGHTYLIRIGKYLFNRYDISMNIFQAVILSLVYCCLFIWLADECAKLTNRCHQHRQK